MWNKQQPSGEDITKKFSTFNLSKFSPHFPTHTHTHFVIVFCTDPSVLEEDTVRQVSLNYPSITLVLRMMRICIDRFKNGAKNCRGR